jgi:hypothetical protein
MLSKELKIGIIGGLITWLLVTIFFEPVSRFLWRAFMTIAGSLHQGYVDGIYRNAAVGERNLVGELTFSILVVFVLASILFYWSERASVGPASSSLELAIKRVARVSDLVFTFALMLLCVTAMVASSVSSGVKEISASFTQRLTVLAPAISDAEYKTLKARWASMKGKADYDALVAAMDKRASEVGVTLPPVRKP